MGFIGFMSFAGAFHVAVDNELPILPVVVSRYDFIDVKNRVFKPSGKVTIRILDPVSTDGMTKADVSGLAENVRNQMAEVYAEISVTDEGAKKSQ